MPLNRKVTVLEDLFRNRLSPLQPVFPQAAWQGAAGDVSGMPAAGRVKHGVPPPRDSWPGPGRQQACRQARLFVPRLLGAQTALPHGSTVPGAQSLCWAQPLPQIPAKPHRLGQQQAPRGTAGSFGEVGAQEARKEPEMKPRQLARCKKPADGNSTLLCVHRTAGGGSREALARQVLLWGNPRVPKAMGSQTTPRVLSSSSR